MFYIAVVTEAFAAVEGRLVQRVDLARSEAVASLDPKQRATLGQVMTPPPVATLMAAMFARPQQDVRLLDPGAGLGALTAATVDALLGRDEPPTSIEVVAYEVESRLLPFLSETLDLCAEACADLGVAFTAIVEESDFLTAVAQDHVRGDAPRFSCAILNPPYRKIRRESDVRQTCRAMGLEVSNLYAAFVGATVLALEDDAELVAITPRSFANGPYFRAFRSFLLSRVALRRLHVFDSRSHAFREDDVLQENVILYAEKSTKAPESVAITSSATPVDAVRSRIVPWGRVVYEHDTEQFIHLIEDDRGDEAAEIMARFDNYLADLGLSVSTGPVVDFRATEFLRNEADETTVPLLYAAHLNGGAVDWPRDRAKWNAFVLNEASRSRTVPDGNFVLVKRFTAKEERRRVVAAVYEAGVLNAERVAFENHLNYFHGGGNGLALDFARGLALYLNSSLVDTYFRQFSGHTQVNATDLRNMPYPCRERLEAAGRAAGTSALDQAEVDRVVEEYLLA